MLTRRTCALALSGALVAAMPEAGLAQALRVSVTGNGSGISANGVYQLQGIVGQPALGASGAGIYIACGGFWCSGGPGIVEVEPIRKPDRLEVRGPSPNPSADGFEFVLMLPETDLVAFSIYDVLGRRVATVCDRRLDAGVHRLGWSTPGKAGDSKPGIYFARIMVGNRVVSERKLIAIH